MLTSSRELTPTTNYLIRRRQIANGVDFRHRMLLFSHDFSPWRNSPQFARASSFSRFHDHTHTHHTRQYSSGRVVSPTQKPLRENTRHPQETDTFKRATGFELAIPASERPLGSAFRHISHYSRSHSLQENEFCCVSVSRIISTERGRIL